MSKRLSQLYGMDIYTEKAERVGRVEDVILNLEKGEVMRLSLKPFKARTLPSDDVRRIIQEESIGYNDVVRAGDIIICRKNPRKEGKRKGRQS
ncbi:MAG: PRC-barrel domain-containing protein [Candidatus Altiarchaeota archaeon]|nr:PRC-barrel domain-containing protein [Candidatus Altiarchaeota archaeon]